MAFDISKLSTIFSFFLLQFSWILYSRGYITCLMTQSKTSCILFSTKWRLHNVASELWGQLTQLELSGENIHLLLFPLCLAIFPKHLDAIYNMPFALTCHISFLDQDFSLLDKIRFDKGLYNCRSKGNCKENLIYMETAAHNRCNNWVSF